MMGLVAVPLGVAGFVTHVNHAMETIQASADPTALHRELSPTPFSSQRGFAATTDSPSPATPVHSFDLLPFINVCLLQLRTPPVPVSPHIGRSTRFPSPSLIVTSSVPLGTSSPAYLHCIGQTAVWTSQLSTPTPYVIQDPCHGFHLTFSYNIPLESALGNMAAAPANLQVINNYLHTEVQLGRVAGPFLQPPYPILHVSGFSCYPQFMQSARKMVLYLGLVQPCWSKRRHWRWMTILQASCSLVGAPWW